MCHAHMSRRKGRGGAGSSAHQLAARLHQKGYSEHLSWLEAYLADEARDIHFVCMYNSFGF